MADYATSVLVTAQALLNAKYAAPEMRHKDYSIIRTLLKGKDAFDTDVNVMKTSDGRAIEAYYLKKRATDAATARAAAHTAASNGDSGAVALTWYTKAQKFKTSLKMSENNMFKDAQFLANLLESAWINLLDIIEALQATYLDTNKTQVNGCSAGEFGEFRNDGSTIDHIFEVKQANKNWLFMYLQGMMANNNYNGMIECINDPVGFAIGKQIAMQGNSNAVNTSFQFSNLIMGQSSSLTPLEGYMANGYLIPEGVAGLITHVPALNAKGTETKLQTYSKMTDPFGLGLTAAMHSYPTAADTNGTGGATQDEVTQYELSIDYANVLAPLSVSTETPIYQFGLLSAGD